MRGHAFEAPFDDGSAFSGAGFEDATLITLDGWVTVDIAEGKGVLVWQQPPHVVLLCQ